MKSRIIMENGKEYNIKCSEEIIEKIVQEMTSESVIGALEDDGEIYLYLSTKHIVAIEIKREEQDEIK